MLRFFYSREPFGRAAKSIAKGSLVLGLLLIGFGLLVFILRDIFAILAAAVFFLAGFSAIGYAVRMFIAGHRMNRGGGGKTQEEGYRENVRIRGEQHHDF